MEVNFAFKLEIHKMYLMGIPLGKTVAKIFVNRENCNKILKTECNLFAVSSGIWKSEKGPIKAVNIFHKILNEKI